jgi:hypothetical protein
LAEGENPHSGNFRGCRQAKEEWQRKKSQKSPKTTTGRVFSSTPTTPGLNFAAGIRGRREQNQRTQATQVAAAVERPSAPTSVLQRETGQSVPASNAKSLPLDNMFRVITVVQQIKTEFNGVVSDEAKVVVITKILFEFNEAKWPLDFIGHSNS